MKKLKLFFALFAMLALGVGNAWAEEYALYSGTITEGDYVIVYDGNAMNNTVSSSRLGYTAVTITGDKISNPAATIVWHIASSGDYWTIFSANVNKYAASTGAKNKAQMLDSGSDDKSLWTVSGSSTYEFVNKANAAANVNKNLRQNGTYGFACYATSTGGALSLYKKVEQSGGGETTEPEPDPDPTPDPEEPDPTPGTGSSTNWVETVIADITASDIVVITMSKDGTTYALTSAKGSSAAPTAVEVTVNGDKLAAEPIDELKWNIATSGTGYIIYPNGINNKYLYCTNTNNGVRVGTGDAKVFTINSGYLYTTQTADARHIGVYNAQDWRCYKPSSGAIASNISGQTLKFYKYIAPSSGGGDEPEPEKTATSLEWSLTEYAVTMGEIPTFPTLTTTPADLTGVTYSSSNGAVATIAADGTITINAVGETTIKASYAGSEIYAAATDATYKLTVKKALANPTDNVYVKVTSDEGLTNGEYLVVYEDETAPVAFDGSLTTLDAAKNTVAVGISNSTIAGNTDIDAALFTIDVTAGTLKSASGKYIGVSSNTNGLKTEDVAKDYKNAFSVDDNGNAVIAADFEGSTMSLRYNNTAGDNNLRFRYYKNAGQQPIALYKKVDPNAVVKPIFTPVAGEYYGTQSVEITCATAGAEVYYTLDGTDPKSTSTKYTGAISITSTTTVKAIAVKGANSSEVVSATYTILAPLATMQAIFDEATEIGKDAVQSVKITFDEWVISAVVPGKDEKPSSNAYITDGDKGFIIYTNTGHGFKVGDKLSGTITCDLTLYNGSAEVKGLTSTTTDLTVVENGTITPVELDATQIEELSGVNTGSVIKITGPCTVDGTKYYVAGVQLYNSLYTYTNPTVGNKYNVTGVYLQYDEIPEILPRSAADIEEIIDLPTATISIANITMEVDEEKTIEATVTPDAAETTITYEIKEGTCVTLNSNTITALAEGTATITATIAEVAGKYYGATKDFTVTVTPKSEKTNVVILAELGGKWYAMKGAVPSGKSNQLDAIEVTYFNGTLYNVPEEVKSSITWTRSVVDGKATFVNNGKYLKGGTSTDLTLAGTVDDNCKWMWNDENGYYTTNTSGTIRTFLYRENYNFKNYGVSQAGKEDANGDYSALPVVAAPVYATGDIVYTRTATPGSFSTICLPYAGTISGATLFDLSDRDETYVYVLEAGTELEAGKPYVILPTANEIVVACKNYDYVAAGSYNALYGTYDDMNSDELDGKYVITGNKYYCVDKEESAGSKLLAYRAYFNLNELQKVAPVLPVGARRIALGTNGQNTATGMENVDASAQPVKTIINGQLFILRGEKMYDAQGKLVK